MTDRAGAGMGSVWAQRKVLVLSPTPTWPLDCGNRRRIYFVCRRLKELGAEIHFLHYPSEEEWSELLPLDHQRRMIAEWDGYYVTPVTRPLYAPSIGQDHGIDEWWDPGIGEVLKWLFRVQRFDVFIVNYAWLSKAFDYAPQHVVKILDTHDRFAGRRDMLESQGLAPDFFHTTEDDERIALQRADVVWAIKSQEETQFRGLTDRRVLTVAHAEPVIKGWPGTRNGMLRFGIAGSANDINLVNFRNFLTVAADYIRRTLLPCEIVLAGTCCDRLGDVSYPFVRQMGRLETMDDFYDDVDIVLGPMEFSTGLKIRIGEALSRAKAIIAHRHCFEGYAPTHAFHSLPSFEAMMQACRDVVRAPQVIDDLELASIESMTRALQSVDRALESTLPARKIIATGFVFVVELSDLWEGSFALDHACEAAEYVGHQCEILFYIDGESATVEKQSLARLAKLGRLMLSKKAVAALERQYDAIAGMHVEVASLQDLLGANQLAFWFTFLPDRMPELTVRAAASAFVPISVLALRVGEPRLIQFLTTLERTFAEVVAMDVTPSRLLAAAGGKGFTTQVVPTLWCTDLSVRLKAMEEAKRESVTFFACQADGTLVDLVHEVTRRSTARPIEFVYDDRPGVGGGGLSEPLTSGKAPGLIPVSDYLRHLRRSNKAPILVVELGQSSAFGALCELMDRAAVPRLSLFDGGAPRPVVAGRPSDRVGGVMESALVLTEWLRDETRFPEAAARGRARYRALDPGWTIIWDLVKAIVARRSEAQRSAANTSGAEREVGAEIVLHVDRDGDGRYAGQGWVGHRGRKQRIEAFGIRPLEALAPADIEYKAFGPKGRETPWVSDATLCGTRGRSLPLTGFAVRLVPHLRDRFDVVYEGAFFVGGVVGPNRNGEPCIAPDADDPLEAMHVRLLERT